MKTLFIYISAFYFLFNVDEELLQGKWKLVENQSFLNILTSEAYNMGSDDEKRNLAEVFQFVLDSTFYTFNGNSVLFTDAGPGGIVKYKKGKWLIKQDTLFIFEAEKIKIHRYLIHSLREEELRIKLVLSDIVVGESILTFKKVR
jgi:hypothetical protein